MTPRDRELLDIGTHAKHKIEQVIQDAAQLCENDYERWSMINAIQLNLIKRLASELSRMSPILASWPEDVRIFAAATFAVQLAMPAPRDATTPRTLTPETLERSWRQIMKAVGNLEGAQRGAHG
jgi:hypothetical protein